MDQLKLWDVPVTCVVRRDVNLSPEFAEMLDVIMLVMGLGLFAVSFVYIYACERL